MNLNDFVVLPNNKARSVKLNARNLQELHMETVTLAQESKEMEEKLQQLKENMGKEKKERGHSGGFRWISGQCGPLNSNTSTNSTKKNSKDRLQKMSAGKVKIRMLKDEPLTAPPPPPASTTGFQTTTKNRLRGTICGQCEVKSAGLMCAECTENYCISCFAKFHQKGALKLHRMILIQADLKTHVSTLDVVSSFQKQIDNSLYPSTFTNHIPSPKFKHYPHPQYNFTSRKCDESPEKVTEDVEKPMPFHPDPSKALVINEGEKKKLEITKEQLKRKDAEEIPESLLRGEFSEEESARSFQEALRQWREEKSGATGELTSESAMWIPARPVSVSAIATQVDLPPDRGAQGRVSGRGIGRIPVMVEFTESSVTYMDRLLLKKHRRTPVEPYHTSQGFAKGLKSLCNTNTEEESANSLTAQDLDFHHYCASLFAVSLSMGREKPQITTPESCLVIEVLDEVKMTEASSFNRNFCKQTTDEDNGFPSVQQVSSNGRTLVPQTTLTSDSGDEISSDSLGLAPHEGDSSEKQAQMHRHTTRGRSRGEEQGNPATSYLGDSFVPADTEREEVLLTDEPEQLSEPSMVLHSQRAGSGSELLCDMHEFTPLGLDVNSGHSDTPEHRYSGPLHTCQTSLQDSNQTGSEDHGPGSSTNREENLIFNITKDSHTASTGGGEKVANELSGKWMVPAFRPLSRATQEIMEICNVDQMGCEDPDLDTDTTAHTLHSLEQELRLLAKETGSQASAFGIGNSGIQNQCENQHFTRSRVSEKQKEDEEAAQRDLQSVLLLS
ncbi:zinc finger B-box domain-containing protein 1 isoform X4 [Anabas testudineus]|uniref:zinc finger B-box domain-containing protein 1 isoform X4 n=1 Tax=Anabas testudineus TaxID=64144 RepID=UPI000E45E491|nr:zinc finger B-box domain-containing protein 1 isoform X4 [Anabas testudineus]